MNAVNVTLHLDEKAIAAATRRPGTGTVASVPARRVEITVPEEMWEEIDAARGEMPRAAWIKQALRAALDRKPNATTTELAEELRRLADKLVDTGTDTV